MSNLSLENATLVGSFRPILEKLYETPLEENLIQIQKTRKEFEGEITLVVFPLLRISKKNPIQTAEEIGACLKANISEIKNYQIVKGFLNLALNDHFLVQQLETSIEKGTSFGFKPPKEETVLVEYSSPNTNKPLHLGHVRNNLLGYSVSEILKANGYQVVKTQIINDRGIHICKSMLSWKKWGNNESPETTDLKGDHLVGKYYVLFGKENKKQAATLIEKGVEKEKAENETELALEARKMLVNWEKGEEHTLALWKKLNNWVYQGFDATYQRLGVDFDKLYYESDTYLYGKKLVEEGLEKGVFFKKEDGSIWCDLSEDGLDQKLLLRADGTAVYITQDLGTAVLRFKDYPSSIQQIYTVGNEQDYHFKVLFLLLQKLGYHWAKSNFHLSYGMMELPTGKMKNQRRNGSRRR